MRVPSFEQFQRISAATAFFVCGMVVGAAVFNGLSHEAYSQVVEKNYELEQQIGTYKDEIEQLKTSAGKESEIRSVVVFIEAPPGKPAIDVVTEKELKAKLKQDLAIFRGRKIYDIGTDSPLARSLLDKKIYAGIGENDYIVTMRTVLLADGVLQVWVEAKVYVRP